MNAFLKYISDRLKERSTIIGLGVLGAMVGMPPGTVETVAGCVGVVAGVAATFLPDSKQP